MILSLSKDPAFIAVRFLDNVNFFYKHVCCVLRGPVYSCGMQFVGYVALVDTSSGVELLLRLKFIVCFSVFWTKAIYEARGIIALIASKIFTFRDLLTM